jgi:hypothetical protein
MVFPPVELASPTSNARAMRTALTELATIKASLVSATTTTRRLVLPRNVLPVRLSPSSRIQPIERECSPRTGYCRNGGCASFPGSTLGQACSSDASCVGVETYSETPAACAGIAGTQATCGGAGAFCYTIAGQFTGESPVCASSTSSRALSTGNG